MQNPIPDKRHLIFGAGLIGCYLGGVLTVLGFSTGLVCRPKVKEKLEGGVVLTDYQDHQVEIQHLDVVSADQPSVMDSSSVHADFLWLTVKCTGVVQAVEDMAPWVKQHTVILCCQNGLGSDGIVNKAFPDNLVLRVMVPFNVVELSDGHFHRGSQGDMVIESTASCESDVSSLVSKLNSELLPISATKNMDALLWAKLQLNLGNSINALADVPVKTMLEDRDYRKVIALLMDELLQVVAALDITLPKITALSARKIPWVLRLPNFVFKRVANKMLEIDPNVRSSMWWDVSQGKPTEIEHLNGAILKYAKQLNIACPGNEKISALIRNLTSEDKVIGIQKPPIAADTLLAWVSNQ